MPEFYEIVHARVRDGIDRLDYRTYLDMLRWESRAAADAAIDQFTSIPEAGEIHRHFAEDLAHHRGEVAAL